jgi:HEAT repeat protein
MKLKASMSLLRWKAQRDMDAATIRSANARSSGQPEGVINDAAGRESAGVFRADCPGNFNRSMGGDSVWKVDEMTVQERIDHLIEALDSADLLIRLNARRQLVELGSQVADQLVSLLHNGSDLQRVSAAIVLGRMGDARAIDSLLEMRTHANSLVRIDGAKALSLFADARVVRDALGDWLTQENNVLVQIAIVESLSKPSVRLMLDALINVLKQTESPSLRYTIIRVLGDSGIPSVREIIFAFLDDTDHYVRREAALALEKLGDNS